MASTVTIGDSVVWAKGSYLAYLAPYGAGELIQGKDYSDSLTLIPSVFPNEVQISWSYPALTSRTAGVYNFDRIDFGDYAYKQDRPLIKELQVNSIAKLEQKYDISIHGDTTKYDVITDFFLTEKAQDFSTYSFEVEILLHTPAFANSYVNDYRHPIIGIYTDLDGRSWQISIDRGAKLAPDILIMPVGGNDLLSGTIDIHGMLSWLTSKNVITGNEYFNGLGMGAETQQGSGSITINSFNIDYASTQNQALFGSVAHDSTSHVGQVYALYEGLLGRAPDQAGAQYWDLKLNQGVGLQSLTQEILGTAEGQSHFNSGGNAAYVEQLYETVLHRHGDANGSQAWTSYLDNGGARAEVADSFVFSQEHLNGLNSAYQTGVFLADPTDATLARLYYGILERAPDAGGLQGFEVAAHNGTTLASIAQSFLDSPEYKSFHPTAQIDKIFVDELYEDLLGRSADAAGEQGWLNALTHGSSRAVVALGIAQSPEAQHHLEAHIEQGWLLA